MGNIITCSTDCKQNSRNSIYRRDVVCFVYIIVNTVHRGDNKYDDDDNTNNTNDNNNNFQKYLQNIGSTKHILRVWQRAVPLPMCHTVRKFLGGANLDLKR